ncbi:MAG: YlbF family regulator [Clostridiaceae bacterium]|nr:YlbF family regulator [Clostridiaceae bacterium]
MNVYDTANQLATEIKKSEEYVKYKEAKKMLESNSELKLKIDEFEKMRYEIQVLAMQGKEVEQEKNKKLQDMYTILIENKEIKEYFDLEVKFNVMLADVNKIIAESVKDVL